MLKIAFFIVRHDEFGNFAENFINRVTRVGFDTIGGSDIRMYDK